MTAALYARVSTDAQSTDGQIAELRRYAAAHGFEAVEYVDHGVSGHRDSRPALDRMLADAEAGRVQVVLAWKIDRLGRSVVHLHQVVDRLRALGVRVIFTSDGVDLETSAGELVFGLLATIAQWESRRISERCRLSVSARRARGARLGPRMKTVAVTDVDGLNHGDAAARLGVSVSTIRRRRRA